MAGSAMAHFELAHSQERALKSAPTIASAKCEQLLKRRDTRISNLRHDRADHRWVVRALGLREVEVG